MELNPNQDGPFCGCRRMGDFSPEISIFNREINIKIEFQCMIWDFFCLNCAFIGCFDRPKCKFNDVTKISNFRPPWNNFTFKKRNKKKCHNVIFLLKASTAKFLLRDSNYILALVKWPKFGNLSISMREVNII